MMRSSGEAGISSPNHAGAGAALAEPVGAIFDEELIGPEMVRYNGAAYLHEHLVSKYCTLLGTSFAAIVAYEDRVGLNYLRTREDVDAGASDASAFRAAACAPPCCEPRRTISLLVRLPA